MAGASIETTLELWAASLRDVKARMRPLFAQERAAVSAGLFLDGLLSSHSRGAPGWMKRLLWCGRQGDRQGDWFCLGVSEPVAEFDRRPFEHPLLSPGTVAGQLRSASVLEHVR